MGREGGEKWTAAAHLQPTFPKSDRLLERALAHLPQVLGFGVAHVNPPSAVAAAPGLEWIGTALRWRTGPVATSRAGAPVCAAAAQWVSRASGARAPSRENLSACSCRLREAPFEVAVDEPLHTITNPPLVGLQ